MTEIHLATEDQDLIVSKAPTLASGDINTVLIVVDFDSSWDEYEAKTASFYTSKDATVYERIFVDEMTMTEGLKTFVIVPPEVLVQKGTLFIAVKGATADGSKVKTSEVIRYKIVEGTPASKKTLFATPDLYQQYLQRMDEGLTPTRTKMEANFQAYTEQAKAELLASLPAALSGELLWENPDPTAEFKSQTIQLDLSKYKRVHIISVVKKHGTNSGDSYSETVITQKDVSVCMFNDTTTSSSNGGNELFIRRAKMSDSSVYFEDAHGTGSYSTTNDKLIPVKIIGYIY